MSQQSGMGFIYIMFILFVGLFTLVILTDVGEGTGNGNPVGRAVDKIAGDVSEDIKRDRIKCTLQLRNLLFEDVTIESYDCIIVRDDCTSLTRQLSIGSLDSWSVDKGYVVMIVGEEEVKVASYELIEGSRDKIILGKGDELLSSYDMSICAKTEQLDSYPTHFKLYSDSKQLIFSEQRSIT